ncbi:MAG: MBL fold metallo-hydrolase [Anaerolineaceae bacterium]|nr:MBL fold metallo-hydrolase [Anaerolineaceae bacterium]
MIQPYLKDEAFLADVHGADEDQFNLWWLGQSGILLQWQGQHLLVDPYLSDSLTKKYADSDKPHVRLVERVIQPERLGFVLGVTSSHNHTDHLDAETILPILAANPALEVVVPEANLAFAGARLQLPAERLTKIDADGRPVRLGPFSISAIPAAHEMLETDESGHHKFLSYIFEAGGRRIFHSGDACLYAGLENSLRAWKIDVAILPINGRDPKRGVPGNFTGEEAAWLGKEIGAGLVIPCHYEMFEFNSVSPQGFIAAAEKAGLPYRILGVGERYSF